MAKYYLPKGFKVSGVHCGIKRFNRDLGLIYSNAGCRAIGVFTRNKIKAAPVIVSKDILAKGEPIHAIIVNSGNANCCTGRTGTNDAKKMMRAVAEPLGLKLNNVLVSSTGVIGRKLQIENIVGAAPLLLRKLSEKALTNLSDALLTTDKKRKIETVSFNAGGREITITGLCKGAGMIHPKMATMLCFIMTDADIDKDALKAAFKKSVDRTFNSISIDGDMSTNDTVIILANGMAGNIPVRKGTKELESFQKGLDKLCLELAKDIVKDGEGATKFVAVKVNGAATEKEADQIARTVANSCLVKTAIHGGDPNWGRIASSAGSTMAKSVKPNKMEIYLDGVCMFKKGRYTHPAVNKMHKIYKKSNVEVEIYLNSGRKNATMFTCDLSKRYVEINSHYMT